MQLTIVSFNVDCDNHDAKRIQALIDDCNPDILCLQEVSQQLRPRLENLLTKRYPYVDVAIDHLADGYFGLAPERTHSHLMIFSRVPFVNPALKHVHVPIGNRTLFGYFRGWHECREHHGVDIVVQDTHIRVINLHIACAATPKNKWRQLKHAVRYHIKYHGEAIICGDFNITRKLVFGHAFVYAIRRVLKSRFSMQKMLQGRELPLFARIIAKRNLHDVCGEGITHPISGLELDKILASKSLHAVSRPIFFHKRYGSDHLPLGVVFDLQT